MTAKSFYTEIVPGYLTRALGYASKTVGPGADPRGDAPADPATPTSPGPLFEVKLGEPLIVRVHNDIDRSLNLDISVHLHGGHTPAHSDGHPNFKVLPGETRDYYYPNPVPRKVHWNGAEWGPSDGAAGGEKWDLAEVPSTMWYHDHANDITAHNALMGLAGLYFLRDAEEERWIAEGKLPAKEFELPLAIRDVCLCRLESPLPDSTAKAELLEAVRRRKQDDASWTYRGEAAIHFNPFDHDGSLGNLVLVNGAPFPRARVQRRRYRLRLLNASLARMYNLQIVRVSRGTGAMQALKLEIVGKDSWLLAAGIPAGDVFMGMANRHDVLVDFGCPVAWDPTKPEGGEPMQVSADDEFYLISTIDQKDGRGPGHGDNQIDPGALPRGQEFSPPSGGKGPMWLMKFVVDDPPTMACRPAAPVTALRPHESILEDVSSERVWGAEWLRKVPKRLFQFERRQGAWQINHKFYDECTSNAVPRLWSTELWVLRNNSGGWWHPIHIHLESHQQIYASARNELGRRVRVAVPAYAKILNASQGDSSDLPAEVAGARRNASIDASPEILDADGDLASALEQAKVIGGEGGHVLGSGRTTWHTGIKHDTTVLGPNTEVHVLMRFRTFQGPFVFHCHNLNHEDMRMMHQFDPRLGEGPLSEVHVRPAFWFFTEPCKGGQE